jgi:hypothetical protein
MGALLHKDIKQAGGDACSTKTGAIKDEKDKRGGGSCSSSSC